MRAHSLFSGGFPMRLVLLQELGDKYGNCHSTAQLPQHSRPAAPCSSICSATAPEVQNSSEVAEYSPFGASVDALVQLLRRCPLQTPSNKTDLVK